jgi:hypothetical protein
MRHVQRVIVAMAAVQVGHAVVHAFPHSHPNESAHGYIPYAAAVVIPLGLAALFALIRHDWRFGEAGVRPIEIAALQVMIFAGQEMTETVAIGGSALGFLTDPVMWAGIAIQLAIGWIAVWALSLARTAIRIRLVGAGRHPLLPVRRNAAAAQGIEPLSRLLAHCAFVRGPPRSSTA